MGKVTSFLKRAMGLERLDDKILDRMCRDDMRLAQFVAPIVIVAVAIVLLVAFVAFPGQGIGPTDPPALLLASLFLFLGCIQLIVASRRYLKGVNANRVATHRALGFFLIAGYTYGVVVSALGFMAFGRMSVFYISLIMGLLFALNPVVEIISTTLATVAFIVVFKALGIGDDMVFISCVSVAVAIVIAAVLRYAQECRGALSNVESAEASRTDGLTGLRNRLAFNKEYAELAGHPLIVGMIDIDDFKYFNDAYSHETGDEVLRKFAHVLRVSFPRAQAYRYGGDEFVLVAVDTSDEAGFCRESAEFLKRTSELRIDGNELEKITASLGYAIGRPGNAAELKSLLHLADRKLYEAKRGGKSRFVGAKLEKNDLTRDKAPVTELPLRRSYETDQLTGLPNMQFFREHGLQFASHLAASGQQPVVVYFNLANFKLVNERQGYRAGDDLLCEVADAIQGAFPDMLLALMAEDHFALICPREGLEEGVAAAREVVDVHKGEPAVSLKAGVCAIPKGTPDIGGPYDSAKIACDSIKVVFGHDLRFYDAELDNHVVRQRYVLDNIHAAISRGDIVVYYQPVYRTMTGRLASGEALVRWKDERYGMIPPGEFIGLLEDTQQVSELDAYVIERVCDDWKEQHDAGEPTLPVSVNFSRVDFQLMDIASVVESNVKRVGMPRQMIHVEVTESAFMEEDEALSRQIERLRKLGYEVWMDDFGSGYSSLNQLKWHDFDLVKIDMAFLKNFEDEQVKTLLSSIVDMIKRLGVQTLIEGVETREQYDFMRAIGCEFVQGFYLSKPIPSPDFRALLAQSADSGALEPYEMRGYYTAASRVNLLSQMPFSFPGDQVSMREAASGALPLAILEKRGDEVHYLMQTSSFAGLLDRLDVDGYLEDRGGVRDLEQTTTKKHFLEFLDTALKDGGPTISDFIIRGHECVARARKIASYAGRESLLFSLEDHSHGTDHEMRDQARVALSYVNTLYDKVDVLDVDSGIVRNVYDRAGDAQGGSGQGRQIDEVAQERVATLVHPSDRKRYLQIFDLATLEERLSRSTYGYLSGLARMLSRDGTYGWKVLLLIPAQTKGGNFVVICRRDANMLLVEEFRGGDDKIMDDLLWEAVLKLLPEKLFWKGTDRRFLGANKAFLDYYGFKSANEIVGKTDEDIGWNMDPEAFKRDELAVIEEGKTIDRAPGICIVKGQPRRIVATKMPLVLDGEILGLIGFFSDVEQRDREMGVGRAAAGQDKLTVALNRFGVLNALAEFEGAAGTGGPDYGVVYLDIDNLREINRKHGFDFGNHVLSCVSARLVEKLGPDCVIGRVRADEFVIAGQFTQNTMDERIEAIGALGTRAHGIVTGVDIVDATRVRVEASFGCSLRSESENASAIVELAEERMRDDRSTRAVEAAIDAGDVMAGIGAGGSRDAHGEQVEEIEMPLHMTRSDAVRRVKVLQEHFDLVRLVDPSTCTAFNIGHEARMLHKDNAHCYAIWGQSSRCADCISARTLADKHTHEKYERLGDDLLHVTARYIDVDGTPCALETAARLPFKVHTSPEAQARFSEELATADDDRYFDRDVHTYNKVYLDETLSHLRCQQVAMLEATTRDMARERDGGFAKEVARAIKGEVRRGDVIVHFKYGRFGIVFDATEPVEGLEELLGELRAVILQIPGTSASIGAVQREGTVSELMQEARLELYRARELGDDDGDADEKGGVLVIGA